MTREPDMPRDAAPREPDRRLRDTRIASGLTQEQLAQLCSLRLDDLKLMEEGLMLPSAALLFEFCRHLKVMPADLVDSATWALVQHQHVFGRNP